MSKKIAILATDGFEEVELSSPKEAYEKEGFTVEVVSDKSGVIKAWASTNWGKDYKVDKTLDQVSAEEYDALVLPGGVINPDKLRINDKAVKFIDQFFKQDKPVAAICHGPWSLINAGAVKGKKMTSYKSISQDLKNAGANWVDEEVVKDGNLITSRNPNDLPAFNKKLIEVLK